MNYKEKLEAETGFKFTTDVWELFTKGEQDEEVDLEELYRELFRKRHNDVKLITELSMCMNWKIWEHHRAGNERLAELYNDLWFRVDGYAKDMFVGDDAHYYREATD